MSFGDQLYMDQLAEDVDAGRTSLIDALRGAYSTGYSDGEDDGYSRGYDDGLDDGAGGDL